MPSSRVIEKPFTTLNEKQQKAAKSETDIGARKTKTGNRKPKQATKGTTSPN